jgi:hypothetical protein
MGLANRPFRCAGVNRPAHEHDTFHPRGGVRGAIPDKPPY